MTRRTHLNAERWSIARYWLQTPEGRSRFPGNAALADLGEPCCFACGWYSDAWPETDDAASAWKAARGLDRAHLTPRSLGGADSAANLVLLCSTCHRAAPDHRVPSFMLDWMTRRARWLDAWPDFVAEAVAMGVSHDDLLRASQRSGFAAAVLDGLSRDASMHGGVLMPATAAAVVVAAVRDQG